MLSRISNNSYIHLQGQIATPQDHSKKSVREKMCKTANKSVMKNCEKIKREPAEINFCGLFSPQKMDNFYKSKGLHTVLDFARDQQLVFGASFALVLTCILRPAAIMIAPSKKNKEDQVYASAHSIASGVIGFAISTILFLPVGNAIKKFGKEHPAFLEKFGKNLKKNSYLKDEKYYKLAKTYIDRAPDIITAVPKGILTVALIPPILKHLFGMQKKKSGEPNAKNLTATDYSLLHFKSTENKTRLENFKGGAN